MKHVFCRFGPKLVSNSSIFRRSFVDAKVVASKIKKSINEQQNDQILSTPYPSFISTLDTKAVAIQQKRFLLDSLSNCNHTNQILAIIQETFEATPQLLNPAIFSCAVKRCNELKQPTACIKLMDLMDTCNITPDLIQYNTVLLSLSKCEDKTFYKETMKYFKQMIQKDQLKPDIYTLTHLLQASRHRVANLGANNESEFKKVISKSEKICNLFLYKFNVISDRLAMTEKALIYANCNKPNLAIAEWNQMIEEHNLRPRVTSCGLAIKAFAKFGDYKSCQIILKYMKNNNIRMNQVILCSLINAYINAHELHKAIEIFDKYVIFNRSKNDDNNSNNNNRNIVEVEDHAVDGNDILFGLKTLCYVKLLENAVSEKNEKSEIINNDEEARKMDGLIEYYLTQIHDAIPYQRSELNLALYDHTMADYMLKSKLIVTGYDNDNIETINWFEQMVYQKFFKIIGKNRQQCDQKLLEFSNKINANKKQKEDNLIITVHLFGKETAKFVLNYIFKHKLKDGTFEKGSMIPIIKGKVFGIEEIRQLLIENDVEFSELLNVSDNSGKLLLCQ